MVCFVPSCVLMVVFGTKDMWKGWTFLKSSNNSIIFAASNYRVFHSVGKVTDV